LWHLPGPDAAVEAGRAYACLNAYRHGAKACPATKRLPRARMDAEMLELMGGTVLTQEFAKDVIEDQIRRAKEAPAVQAEEIAEAEKEIARLKAGIARLVDRIEQGLDDPAIDARLKELRQELLKAQARREHLDGRSQQVDQWADPKYQAAMLKAAKQGKLWLDGKKDTPPPVNYLRSLLRKVVEQIVVTPGTEGEDGPSYSFKVTLSPALLARPIVDEVVRSYGVDPGDLKFKGHPRKATMQAG
jgi:cell division protein FtsB